MSMLAPLLERNTQLVEIDEASEEHTMAPIQRRRAFLSKLVKSSHLLEVSLSPPLEEIFVQLLGLDMEIEG